MGWIVGIFAAGVILILMVNSPGFRYTVLLIATGVGLYIFVENERQERQKAHELSLITKSDLEFSEVSIKREFADGTFWNFTAVVKNRSRYTLHEINLNLTVENCDEKGQNCVAVGSDDSSEYMTIPPGQARQLKANFMFSDLPPPKNPTFVYSVVWIRGR